MAVSEQFLQAKQRELLAARRMTDTLNQVAAYFRLTNVVRLSERVGIKRSTLQTKLDGTKMWAHEVEAVAYGLGIPVEVLHLPADQAVAWLMANRPNRGDDLPPLSDLGVLASRCSPELAA